MKSSLFDGVWSKILWSTLLVGAIIFLSVAPLYESSKLVQVTTGTAFIAFWAGVLLAEFLTTREIHRALSLPLPLVDRNNHLHPLMSVGERYSMLTYLSPSRGPNGRVYLLQSSKDPNKVFCVLTSSDFRLPHYFCVTKKVALGSTYSRFVFEHV